MRNKPTHLQCNYATDPLGIHPRPPLFSWRMDTDVRGKAQSAYRILVAQTREELAADNGSVWDSGKVTSSDSAGILYQGKTLTGMTEYVWKVKLWDEGGVESSFSAPAFFETALNASDWSAVWIGNPTVETTYQSMAPMFRKRFVITKPVRKARAYVSGLGYYELRLNGDKVGDHVLDPGWTDYSKRVLYAVYDVSDRLVQGDNVVGAMVGVGWHRIPKFKLQLVIWYEDGSLDTIITEPGSGWMVSVEGPLRMNSIYNGETYDARKEIAGWDTSSYDPEAKAADIHRFQQAVQLEGPGGQLEAQELEAIRVIGHLEPVAVTEPKPGVWVYDLGQNIAGWANIRLSGESGTEVRLRFAELVNDDGTINTLNLRSAQATDTYILKGTGEETYEPRFTYHGFRYIQVEGWQGKAEIHELKACIVRSAVNNSGTFECSNELINQIHRNVVWTESNNLHSVPTDCPQRDERMGWLNDLTVRSEEAIYNFNLSRFYVKYMQDIADTQGEETGAISDTAPATRLGCSPADPVSTSYLLLPWLVYVNYGNKDIVAKHYDGIKRWAAYLERHTEDHIVTFSYYGDWASPISQSLEGSLGAGAVSAATPGRLMSTGYHYYNTVLMAKMARILDKAEEAERYENLAAEIAASFHKHFYDSDKGYYGTGSQAAQVFPLYLGIAPDTVKPAVMEHLVRNIMEENDGHLTTGNLCSRYVLDVLADNGRLDVAYLLATQTTYPSWGYMIENGATTIWERWEYVTDGPLVAMASHDHPMYGAVGAWFYKMLAGIEADPEGPGFAKFNVKPRIPEGLSYANCSLNTVRGEASVHWEHSREDLRMTVKVPWNSEAIVAIPLREDGLERAVVWEGDRKVWDKGKWSGDAEGVRMAEQDQPGYLKLVVRSGKYAFKA